MAGWAANNKFTLFGGLRSSAQMFSYELALGLSLGGRDHAGRLFRMQDIVDRAGRRLLELELCRPQLLAFLSTSWPPRAEANRTPFDLPEARDRAGRRLPHRVLLDAVRPDADGRVRAHDHRRRAGHEPVPGRLACPLRLCRRALRQPLAAPGSCAKCWPRSSSSSGCAARCPASATTSSWTSAGRCSCRWPSLNILATALVLVLAALDRHHPLLRVRALALVSALVMIGQRNPIYSAFALIADARSLSGHLRPAGLPVHRRAADGRLRRRDHGAVPVRDDAAQREARAGPRGRQPRLKARHSRWRSCSRQVAVVPGAQRPRRAAAASTPRRAASRASCSRPSTSTCSRPPRS